MTDKELNVAIATALGCEPRHAEGIWCCMCSATLRDKVTRQLPHGQANCDEIRDYIGEIRAGGMKRAEPCIACSGDGWVAMIRRVLISLACLVAFPLWLAAGIWAHEAIPAPYKLYNVFGFPLGESLHICADAGSGIITIVGCLLLMGTAALAWHRGARQ